MTRYDEKYAALKQAVVNNLLPEPHTDPLQRTLVQEIKTLDQKIEISLIHSKEAFFNLLTLCFEARLNALLDEKTNRENPFLNQLQNIVDGPTSPLELNERMFMHLYISARLIHFNNRFSESFMHLIADNFSSSRKLSNYVNAKRNELLTLFDGFKRNPEDVLIKQADCDRLAAHIFSSYFTPKMDESSLVTNVLVCYLEGKYTFENISSSIAAIKARLNSCSLNDYIYLRMTQSQINREATLYDLLSNLENTYHTEAKITDPDKKNKRSFNRNQLLLKNTLIPLFVRETCTLFKSLNTAERQAVHGLTQSLAEFVKESRQLQIDIANNPNAHADQAIIARQTALTIKAQSLKNRVQAFTEIGTHVNWKKVLGILLIILGVGLLAAGIASAIAAPMSILGFSVMCAGIVKISVGCAGAKLVLLPPTPIISLLMMGTGFAGAVAGFLRMFFNENNNKYSKLAKSANDMIDACQQHQTHHHATLFTPKAVKTEHPTIGTTLAPQGHAPRFPRIK